jgi:hypothetical protein
MSISSPPRPVAKGKPIALSQAVEEAIQEASRKVNSDEEMSAEE